MKKNQLFAVVLSLACAACQSVTSPYGENGADGKDGVTPPIMGWSSWNTFGVNINEDIIKAQADAMVDLGFKEAGYSYINIDDGFFGWRDSVSGKMTYDANLFPSGMRAMADYIHSKGLKAGIYSDAGISSCHSISDPTCPGVQGGLYGYDLLDAKLYFDEWDFDFIKVDYCGGMQLGLDEKKRYHEIYEAIQQTDKKDRVSMNICRWDFPGTWAKDIAASWRISGDIGLNWNSIKYIIDKNMYLSAYAGRGHYNDMDMLEIGRGLPQNEEEVHFGMWCIMSSPLLIGCDMTTIPESSKKLMQNKELIAINQDRLGLQAYVVSHENEEYVFVKDIETLHGTARAVALYNPTDTVCAFDVPLEKLELGGEVKVRDLIAQQDCGVVKGSLTYTLPPRSIKVFRLEAEERLDATLYEGEWAYLPCFNALDIRKFARYSYSETLSGKTKIGFLGARPENYAEWKNVYSSEGGNYDLTVTYVCDSNRSLYIEVNGVRTNLKNLNSGSFDTPADVTVSVSLNPGYNTVRMGCDYNWAPDIDKFFLKKK